MKRLTKLFILGMVVLLFLVACGSDEGTSENENNVDENNISEEDNSEVTEVIENSDEALSLGETGKMSSTVGEYELTVNSFEILDAHNDNQPVFDEYVVVDIKIKNVGDENISGDSITRAALFNDGGTKRDNTTNLDFINQISDDIAPGEEVEGQLLFDIHESEYYDLVFGYAASSVSTELTWHFTREEAN